jgi:hypothetical protein
MMKAKNAKAWFRLLLFFSILALVSGCGGKGGTSGEDGVPSSIVTSVKSAEPPAECPDGGITVYSGVDSNRNGRLDDSEIQSAQAVCNGEDGQDGATALVDIVPEPAGANCDQGGSRINVGLDLNANGVLDDGETTSHDYICNGDTGPVGPPGSGVTWETKEISFTAEPDMGYIINGGTQVMVTLPDSAALKSGDIIEVDGIGAGGWRIVQQPDQSIITKNIEDPQISMIARGTNRPWTSVASSADGVKLAAAVSGGQIYTSTDSGVTWTARESNRSWLDVASSADGVKLAAVVLNGQIYTSTDSGVSWTPHESNRLWHSIASSSDGSRLVAAVDGGQIYTSTDSGVTWTARQTNRNWWDVTSSADGVRIAAIVSGGSIYSSTNGGISWNEWVSSQNWRSVASSSDGAKLAAVVSTGQIYTSTDSGISWIAHNSNRYWSSVASSADGTRLAAVVSSGQIYTSTDSGETWNPGETARTWSSVALSADGAKMAATTYNGMIYTINFWKTTQGPNGFVSGSQYDSLSLQYIGGGMFNVIDYLGTLTIR